jgi:hypothetical protein
VSGPSERFEKRESVIKQVSFVIVGAGDRGQCYARTISRIPRVGRVTGVAELREFQRSNLATTYALPSRNVLADWRDLLDRDRGGLRG